MYNYEEKSARLEQPNGFKATVIAIKGALGTIRATASAQF